MRRTGNGRDAHGVPWHGSRGLIPSLGPTGGGRSRVLPVRAVIEDAGRGWRRVVPSPTPLRTVEGAAIRSLIESGFVVISVGGGGIPVVADENGNLAGVAAVIDKDLGCSLLATCLDAEPFLLPQRERLTPRHPVDCDRRRR